MLVTFINGISLIIHSNALSCLFKAHIAKDAFLLSAALFTQQNWLSVETPSFQLISISLLMHSVNAMGTKINTALTCAVKQALDTTKTKSL